MPTIDVRAILPRDRHPLIFRTFDDLQPGESFELINDHAPRPLYYQFLHERTDLFEWRIWKKARRSGVCASHVLKRKDRS